MIQRIFMKFNFKPLLILTSLATVSFADIAATTQDIRAFVLPEDTVTVQGSYLRTSDAVDFLNLNGKAVAGDIYSGLDDSSGMDISLGYGLHQFVSLYYNFEALNINYAGSSIENRKNELFARVNFYDTPHYTFDAFSLDIGYIQNSADDFNNLSDLSDNSYYMRLLIGSKFTSSLLNFYTGAKYSSITTTLNATNIDRDERTLMAGISYTQEMFSNYILDANYEYMRMVGRDGGLGDNKSNHTVNIHLSRAFSEDFLLYIGTKIMLNQFNGAIPYLYNTQTQSSFDKKYSLIKAGFVYNFDMSEKNNKNKVFTAPAFPEKKSTSLFSFFGW